MRTPKEWLLEMQQQQGQSHCTTHAFIQSIQADASQELSRLRDENQELKHALKSCADFLSAWGEDTPSTRENRMNAFRDQARWAVSLLSRLEGGGK